MLRNAPSAVQILQGSIENLQKNQNLSWLYLWINLAVISIPLLLSFDKKVAFFRSWKYLFPAIAGMMALFIPWDIYFTIQGHWGFNPDYLTGISILNLPIEEWLFFICIPFACAFIYEVAKAYRFPFLEERRAKLCFALLGLAALMVSILHIDQAYTFWNFLLLGLFITASNFSKLKIRGQFLTAYLISIFPFLIVNGILTGSATEQAIVWYSSEAILNYRCFTIPVEDFFYGFLMLWMVVFFLENLRAFSNK